MGSRAVVLAAAALALTACGANPQDTSAEAARADQTAITVLAAASLTEPMTELAQAYEAKHPDVDVRVSFGSSTTLAQQVARGAPADVIATAGEQAMTFIPEDLRAGDLQPIARNALEIAVPPGNPGHVDGLSDLADVKTVLCVATAPCGRAADTVLARAGVSADVVSREIDVKATLTKVRLGEVDAAVVYHSDVVSAGDDVDGVAIPEDVNVTLPYPVLRLTEDAAAQDFTAYLLTDEASGVLQEHGLLAP